MQEADVNVYSEFMVLAAALLEIKSKMLLPKKQCRKTMQGRCRRIPGPSWWQSSWSTRRFKTISEMLEKSWEECIFAPGKTAGGPRGIYGRA